MLVGEMGEYPVAVGVEWTGPEEVLVARFFQLVFDVISYAVE